MKFEQKYPDCTPTQKFEFEYSYVTKAPKLGWCQRCGSMTRWLDVIFQVNVCSEECGNSMWKQYREDEYVRGPKLDSHLKRMKEELTIQGEGTKDILIVVRDQLDYFKACIDSIRETTKDYHLYVWDNASGQETVDFILQLEAEGICTAIRSDKNKGFIEPNNRLVEAGSGEYIILLNSDTKVFSGWDRTLIGYLQQNTEVAQVGYYGGHLGPDGRGFGGDYGSDVDFIPGWCFCISRKTVQEFGLFNDELHFAYCEDADFSLRLKEAGKKIFALSVPLVHHYQNVTIKQVEQEGEIDVRASFAHNHNYLKTRWKQYLEKERVLLKRKDSQDVEYVGSIQYQSGPMV